MEFNSDLKFNNNTSRALENILIECNDLGLTQPNYQIFIFCAYLGLTLGEKEKKYLQSQREERGRDLTIPRNILIKNEYALKELLISSEYVKNSFEIDNFSLQKIWNQESFSTNEELKKYVLEKVEMGSCYFEDLLKVGLDISTLVKKIDERVKKLRENIEERIQENININEDLNIDIELYIEGINNA